MILQVSYFANSFKKQRLSGHAGIICWSFDGWSIQAHSALGRGGESAAGKIIVLFLQMLKIGSVAVRGVGSGVATLLVPSVLGNELFWKSSVRETDRGYLPFYGVTSGFNTGSML